MDKAIKIGVMIGIWAVFFQIIDWALMGYQDLDYFFLFR